MGIARRTHAHTLAAARSCDDADSSFEQTMMQLEQIMMDEAFNKRVGDFLTAHCHEFDEGDENKLA